MTCVAAHRHAGQGLPSQDSDGADNRHGEAQNEPSSPAAPEQSPPHRAAGAELLTTATQRLADGAFAGCLVSVAAAERIQGQPAAALQQMALICRIHVYAADGAWHEVWQLAGVTYGCWCHPSRL